jgi:predicted metal-dependent enzyme (double-stranded beta helix superfamily)
LNPLRRKVVLGAAAAAGQLMLSASAMAKQKRPTSVGADKLDLERFVEDCIAANAESDAQNAVKEVLARAVSTPSAVLAAVGEPDRAGIVPIHRSKTLTIFNARWTPQMNLMPHNHLMWANIGIYTGREDNIFWRETDDSVAAFHANALFQRDTAALPVDAVHSVTNPLLRFTGGIHIYGGDFFNTTRSQWNAETLEEEPSDGAAIREMFRRENERLGLGQNS